MCDSVLLLQCYAPTNDAVAEDQKKTDFYELLQSTVDKTKANNLVLVMGDLNAKTCNVGY